MILKAKTYDLQKINNSYYNSREQDFNIQLEEADIKTPIPETNKININNNSIFSLNISNLAKATNVGFKGGRLKLGTR